MMGDDRRCGALKEGEGVVGLLAIEGPCRLRILGEDPAV